jgi:HAD superfamily hydrolase (TIGR01509 family)
MTPLRLLEGKRLLIFDFDGTLADTSPLHARAFREVLRPWGVPVHYPAIAGMRTADAVAALTTRAGVELSPSQAAALSLAKQQRVRELVRQDLLPLPGVAEFLVRVKGEFRLALYSSGSRATVEAALRKLGYLGWFDPLICAEDVENAKPHPEGFLRVLELTAVAVQEALVFEDSAAGLVAARLAGIAAVCVDPSAGDYGQLASLPWDAWKNYAKGALP